MLSATFGMGGSVTMQASCALFALFEPQLLDVRLVAIIANYRTCIGNLLGIVDARKESRSFIAILVLVMLPFGLCGSLIGLHLYRSLSLGTLRFFTGVACIVTGVQRAWKMCGQPSERPIEQSDLNDATFKLSIAATGLAMGICGGSIGIPAIPFFVLFLYYPMHPTDMRTLGMIATTPVAAYSCIAMLGSAQQPMQVPWISILVSTYAGSAMGLFLHKYVNIGCATRVVLVFLICTGVLLII